MKIMKKQVFEYWDNLAEDADKEDITAQNFVADALTWAGWDTVAEWRDKKALLYKWFDEWEKQQEQPKQKTNADFVNGLMNDDNRLMQIFVVECLERWSQVIIENKEQLFESQNPFINPHAWIACAEKVLAEKEAFYKI